MHDAGYQRDSDQLRGGRCDRQGDTLALNGTTTLPATDRKQSL